MIDNGILVRDNNWSSSHWNGKTYDRYDKKYDVIKEKFDLERVSDVLWLKFTDTDVTKELKRTEFDGLDKYFNNSIA
ncbi:hypothetical protein [Clostridium fessum]|uniref:hypothetical protein n=1 Tax=Clostridium fessum TaxID=2126740 RepID=UPI0022E6C63C|nr:hypothetical protein [Clostridium fessum]